MKKVIHSTIIPKNIAWLLACVMFISQLFVSCNKKFDEPPYDAGDPDLTTNMTIKQVRELYTGSNATITDDVIFSGIVISNDSSGNIFKQLFIEDSTGGINLQLDASNLNALYPLGMRVFVKAKGLTIGTYGGMVQLGLGTSTGSNPYPSRIPQGVISNYVIPGSRGHVVEPLELTIAQLNSSYQSMLIRINKVEFQNTSDSYGDTTTYLDANGSRQLNETAVNRTLNSCDGGSIILRNSSYASFAGDNVKSGNGTITAIYTFYNTANQLLIRDLKDVDSLVNTRCDGTSGGGTGGGTGTATTIAELRALYQGSAIKLGSGTITGIVVSSPTNEAANNYKIAAEDNSAGIAVYQATNRTTLALGDKVSINIAGDSLLTYNGDLELKTVGGITITGSGGSVTPRTTTLADIVTNRSTWSSTMVTVPNVAVSVGSMSGTTGLNYNLTDGTTTIATFVRTTSSITLTEGTATITGYVSSFGSTNPVAQITIRQLGDVVYDGTGGGTTPVAGAINLTTSPLLIDFNSIASGLPTGLYVKARTSTSYLGADTTFTSTVTDWNNAYFAFKNFASASDASLSSSAASAAQTASTNRALGVRQTGATDANIAFVFAIANTTGKSGLKLSFNLQSLDITSPRIMNWTIDYGIGDNPTTFTTAPNITGTLTTGNSLYSNNNINVDFGSILNNIGSKIYIRIIATGSTGSGNRPSSAIDDVNFTWD